MAENSIRLDKWLWFARIVKSRTLAHKLIRSGNIRINKQKYNSPAKCVIIGDVLTITLERRIIVLKIIEYGVRRGPFIEACGLYQDLTPVVKSDPLDIGKGPQSGGQKIPRPDKQDRRKLLRLKKSTIFSIKLAQSHIISIFNFMKCGFSFP